MLQLIKIRFVGTSPMICHSGQLADPLSTAAKNIKRISSKRKKTDSDLEQMAKHEFFGSLYMSDDGPCIPYENIEACIVDGAKKLRRGPDAKAAVFCTTAAQINYDGPRDAESLWEDKRFVNRSGVRVQRARVFRTRPIFHEWSLDVELEYEDSVLNKDEVVDFAKKAGSLVGIGDWRPRYGRFKVVA